MHSWCHLLLKFDWFSVLGWGGGEQYVEVVPQMEKQRRLEQILRSQERGSKVIIFCSTKRLCDQLSRNLGRGFGAAAIHGDKSQGERDWVLNQFRSGKSPILVATDVAARGLDIKDIRWASLLLFPLWYGTKRKSWELGLKI